LFYVREGGPGPLAYRIFRDGRLVIELRRGGDEEAGASLQRPCDSTKPFGASVDASAC
jgi:hypothetical protein